MPFKVCQQFKKINTLYGSLQPSNIAELKNWGTVHVDLIGTYRKSIINQQTVGATIKSDVSLTYMKMIDPQRVGFKLSKFRCLTSMR